MAIWRKKDQAEAAPAAPSGHPAGHAAEPPAGDEPPRVSLFANANPPIRAQAYTTQRALQDLANAGSFKANPTMAAGDFKVSKDGGAFTNLATLPVCLPAGSVSVQFNLSATEMDADVVMVTAIDQTSPKEWADYYFTVETASASGGGGAGSAGGKILEI